MKHFMSLERKIKQMEMRHRQREQELQQVKQGCVSVLLRHLWVEQGACVHACVRYCSATAAPVGKAGVRAYATAAPRLAVAFTSLPKASSGVSIVFFLIYVFYVYGCFVFMYVCTLGETSDPMGLQLL